jgi:hypothetical protein
MSMPARVRTGGTRMAWPASATAISTFVTLWRCGMSVTLSAVRGGKKKAFSFATIGQLAAIGRRTGVARIFGVNFSGFIAWFLWRTIYLSKLPRFEKKLRGALDWTLDLLFTKDLVQFETFRARTISHDETAFMEQLTGVEAKGKAKANVA